MTASNFKRWIWLAIVEVTMRYLLAAATVLVLGGIAQAEEVRVRRADYCRGRPVAAHRAAQDARYRQPRRYDDAPYGWTSRRPKLREQRRLRTQPKAGERSGLEILVQVTDSINR